MASRLPKAARPGGRSRWPPGESDRVRRVTAGHRQRPLDQRIERERIERDQRLVERGRVNCAERGEQPKGRDTAAVGYDAADPIRGDAPTAVGIDGPTAAGLR